MRSSRIDAVTLAAAMIAAGVGHTLPALPASIVGIVLILVLFAYDREGYRSGSQSLAFAAVFGFCFVVALRLLDFLGVALPSGVYSAALAWLIATLVIWAIDRGRMSARETADDYRPETIAAPIEASSAAEPAAPIERSVAAEEPLQIRAGKEVSIYVNLVGEGLHVMRSVRAEQVARNYYRITEEMPETETWEFRPGQVVRCEKRKLSTGKGLVAVEEAKRK
ncbi:MAG: hypothetical protein JOY62_12785 [Acidobacteriaceae bacterium]|nr:hypothetical protein [Acidobacteriaceae bacterium]MBV9780836.1 hypothetical protein [Acidobacteriaceae bacterium]